MTDSGKTLLLRVTSLALLVAALVFTAQPAEAAKRLALVIGNDTYEEIEPLARAVADGDLATGITAIDPAPRAEIADLPTALDAEAPAMVRSMSTADHREAAAAFVEKRDAVFRGA